MAWDDIGVGAGGGFLSGLVIAILSALGMKSDINALKKSVMYKDTFDQFEKRFVDTVQTIKKMDEKIDTLLSRRREDRDEH